MQIDVYDTQGKVVGSVELDDTVWGIEPHVSVMHQALVRQQANARLGTHQTKTRGEVRGGGKKPWRQKGTGRARQGSIRAPHFAGGGTVFGPTPRHYTVKVNRKARKAALRCALSIHADRGSVFGLDAGGFDAPSTKQAAELLEDRRGGSVLVVLSEEQAAAFKSFRNLAGVNVLLASDCGVADLVGAASVVFSEDALESLTARARKAKEVAA